VHCCYRNMVDLMSPEPKAQYAQNRSGQKTNENSESFHTLFPHS